MRPDVPAELETVMRRMMAHQREDRYPTPQALMRALLPFVTPVGNFGSLRPKTDTFVMPPSQDAAIATPPVAPRILIVDDEAGVRSVCKSFFRNEVFELHEAGDGEAGWQALKERPISI